MYSSTESPSIAIARDGGAVYGGRGYQVLAQLLLEEDFFPSSACPQGVPMGKLTGTNERMVRFKNLSLIPKSHHYSSF